MLIAVRKSRNLGLKLPQNQILPQPLVIWG